MKNIFCFLIVVCLHTATGTANGQTKPSVLLLDSVYGSSWVSNNWSLLIKNYQIKNGTGQTIQSLFKKYNQGTGQFLDYIRILYNYPAADSTPSAVSDQLSFLGNWITYQYAHYLAKDIIDTSYYKNWNSQKHTFIEGVQNTYQYNDSLLPVENITRAWDTTSLEWINTSRHTFTYTASMKPSEQVVFSWINSTSTWANNYKYADVYDVNDLEVSHLEYEWNDSAANWQSTLRITYYYNPTSMPNLVVKELWNSVTHAWDSLEMVNYIYNQFNWLMTVHTQDYYPGQGKWMDSYLTYYTYFVTGDWGSMTGNVWDTNNLTWVIDNYEARDSITKKLSDTYRYSLDPQTFAILSGTRNVYTFKTAGDTLTSVAQDWNVSDNSWLNKSQVIYTYETHNLLAQTLTQAWTAANSSWTNSRKSDYYYSDFIGIGEHPAKEKPCIYANPIVAGSSINCRDFIPGHIYTLRIHSLSGSEVYRTQFRGGESVTISKSLAPGLYFLILEENNTILYKDKIVVIR
jgi:hypothetical protein